MVNQKPTPVDDFGNVKVNRVACGSSHSVAWQAYEPPVCTSVEPVTLNAINDPLGANLLGILVVRTFSCSHTISCLIASFRYRRNQRN